MIVTSIMAICVLAVPARGGPLGQRAPVAAGTTSTAADTALSPSSARCPGARKGLLYYRNRTWELQRARRVPRALYGNAHRSRSCPFVRWAADRWRTRARAQQVAYWREARLVSQLGGGPGYSYPRPPGYLARVIIQTWPPGSRQTATCLSYHESGYNTWRRVEGSSWSASGDHAWWQINYVTWRGRGESEWAFHRRLANVSESARVAYSISRGGRSWSPWTGTYGRGLCRGLR